MDAVKFVNERNRMCDYYNKNCTGCPLDGKPCTGFSDIDVESTVAEVEAWSAAHPHKTRQTVFLEQYPNAGVKTGVLSIYPCSIDQGVENTICCNSISCADCRIKFWSQEVE